MGDGIGCETHKTAREIERLKSDIERLRLDIQTISGDLAGAVRTGAEQARDFARDSAESTIKKLKKSKDFVEESVSEHPLISISVALAAGMAAGALLMRRDSTCD